MCIQLWIGIFYQEKNLVDQVELAQNRCTSTIAKLCHPRGWTYFGTSHSTLPKLSLIIRVWKIKFCKINPALNGCVYTLEIKSPRRGAIWPISISNKNILNNTKFWRQIDIASKPNYLGDPVSQGVEILCRLLLCSTKFYRKLLRLGRRNFTRNACLKMIQSRTSYAVYRVWHKPFFQQKY